MVWAGFATEREGKPVILWNKKTNQQLSTTDQIFIYLHECAHHTLGHLYRLPYTPTVELEADCWAIQLMVDGRMIKGRHLDVLEKSRRTTRGDAYHLGGEAHIQSLQRGRMLDSTTGDPVYEALLDAPGTYDCEVVGAAVRCLVFAARKAGAAKERFERLMNITYV